MRRRRRNRSLRLAHIPIVALMVLCIAGLMVGGTEGTLITMVAGNLGILYGGLVAQSKRDRDD